MTGVPALGDFLGAAHRHLGRSATWPGTAAHGRDLAEVTGSLLRFITVTGRYADDVLTSFGEVPDRDRRRPADTAWPQAAADALAAMSAASSALVPADPADPAAQPPGQLATCKLARRLDAATKSLLVGRDLLQAHFAPGRRGRVHRSGWAPVIASPAVAEALLADIAALAGQAATLTAGIPAAAPPPTRQRSASEPPAGGWPTPTASCRLRSGASPCQLLTGSCCTPFPPPPSRPGGFPATGSRFPSYVRRSSRPPSGPGTRPGPPPGWTACPRRSR
jgi:hypothetical protein